MSWLHTGLYFTSFSGKALVRQQASFWIPAFRLFFPSPGSLLPLGLPMGNDDACNRMEENWGRVWDWHLHKQDLPPRVWKDPWQYLYGESEVFMLFLTSWSFLWEISSMPVLTFLLPYLEPCTQQTLGPAGWHFHTFYHREFLRQLGNTLSN